MIGDWLETRESLEEQLASDVPEVAQRRRLRDASIHGISKELPDGFALVDFVHYRECDFRTIFTRKETDSLPGHYLVFVLRAGDDEPRVVDLGPAAAIDSLIVAWRQQLQTGTGDAGAALRAALFDPVFPLVEGCRGLVIAPDGELLHVPLDALPLANGGCLMDRFIYRQIIAGRDLLRQPALGMRSEAVVVGDPDFALTLPVTAEVVEEPLPMPTEGGLLGRLQGWFRRALGGKPDEPETPPAEEEAVQAPHPKPEPATPAFEPLPTTRGEAESVARTLGVRPWLGEEATAARLLSLRSPRMLHLATHCQFLQDRRLLLKNEPAAGESLQMMWENPLRRAFVVMAGGALVTAHDITTMDLTDTRLVVFTLSETPVGQLLAWSKVSGLISGCVQAGAAHVILSLWRAPESARRELVDALYRHLQGRRTPADALRLARLEIRERHPDPRHWAGWVCIGGGGD